jgi:hypothetical protein
MEKGLYKNILFVLFLVAFNTSCGIYRSKLKHSEALFKKRNIDEYYRSAIISKFFLSDIPGWLNFSESGQCFRDLPIKFFNFRKLKGSFGLTYKEAIHFQALYNEYFRQALSKTTLKFLPLKEEEKIFFHSLEQVKAKNFLFQRPTYKVINLVWIDPMIANNSKKGMKRLRIFLNSKKGSSGHPVLLSLCKSRYGLNKILKKNKLDNQNIKVISAAMFSVFNTDDKNVPFFSLGLDLLFRKNQALNFFMLKGKKPREFDGRIKVNFL